MWMLFYVPNPDTPGGLPFASMECHLNPSDPEQVALWRQLANQTHWHLTLLGAGNRVHKFFEFENNYGLESALETMAPACRGMPVIDFMAAKQEFWDTYTMDDLYQMASEPSESTKRTMNGPSQGEANRLREIVSSVENFKAAVPDLHSKTHPDFMKDAEDVDEDTFVSWIEDEDLKHQDVERLFEETQVHLEALHADVSSREYSQFLFAAADAFRRCANSTNFREVLTDAKNCCEQIVHKDPKLEREIAEQFISIENKQNEAAEHFADALKRATRARRKPWWKFW
ncbi:MAG: hypothetical protein QOE70_2372 [Chthoniobacter sp.]|jgi:hypothetical protein|nr:hypothetical protein [Chthoniobacter sp.]